MRKRKYLIGTLIAALAISGATVAFGAAGQKQTITLKVKPKNLPNKKKKYRAASLNVVTETTNTTAANQVPSPATLAKINFDNEIKIVPGVSPKCAESAVAGKDTAAAKAACPNAIVGGGSAVVFVPGPNPPGNTHGTFNAEVTAFNGQPKGGKPTILLHTYTPALVYAQDLVGVLNPSTAGKDYKKGKRLDVTIPPLPLGAALTKFITTVGNGFKKGYIKAHCTDRNHKINAKSVFTYQDGSSLPASGASRCT
jgi:hypothetical protein